MDLEALLEWIRDLPPWLGLSVLFAGALIEYIVPPFPGDTIVVAGAALVAIFDWPMWPVFATVTTGSVVGSAAADAFGRALGRNRHRGAARNERLRLSIETLGQRFERHGTWLLAINRFLPGVRSLLFVAAGYVGMSRWKVLLWSAVSASVWNGLLVTLGFMVGENLALLEQMLARYATVVGVIVLVVVLWNAWRVWRIVRRTSSG